MCVGAAGNFLAPISLMSENAFRTVMEIDTVLSLLSVYIFTFLFDEGVKFGQGYRIRLTLQQLKQVLTLCRLWSPSRKGQMEFDLMSLHLDLLPVRKD